MGVPYAEVIGDPVAHSKSPLIHKFWLGKLGMEGDYRALRVTPEELPRYFSSRRADPDWRGCNLTMPLKQEVLSSLDHRRDANIGAVNCVVPLPDGLTGFNTDVLGVTDALPGQVDTRRPVCIIGAGGAARAAIAGLDLFAAYSFHIIARRQGEGRGLVEGFGMEGSVFALEDAAEALAGAAGVINATPLGMAGHPPMPAPILDGLARVGHRGFAFDMVYDPLHTSFLAAAAARRLRTIDGLAMLVGQAAAAFELLFGTEPPRRHDAELRALLTS